MGEPKERPKINQIEVKVPGAKGELEARKGANLDDVLRAIVWDLKVKNRWPSDAEAARQLGLTQQTHHLLMNPKPGKTGEPSGTSVATLSSICAALRMSPIALLGLHERYADEVHYAEDFVFDRFRSVLDKDEASRVLPLLAELKRRGALNEVIDAAERILPASAKPATRSRKAAGT